VQHPDPLLKLTRLAFLAALALLIMSGVAWGIMAHMARSTQTTVQPTDSGAIILQEDESPLAKRQTHTGVATAVSRSVRKVKGTHRCNTFFLSSLCWHALSAWD